MLNDRETCHKPSSLVGPNDRLLNVRTSKNVDLLSCFSIYKMFHQVVAHWEEGGGWGGEIEKSSHGKWELNTDY